MTALLARYLRRTFRRSSGVAWCNCRAALKWLGREAERAALPCQTREQATATDFNEPLARTEGSSPFFVEDAKCHQADIAYFLSRRMFSRLSRALRVIVSKDGVGVAMDALLASDNDNPAAPRTGTVFRLEVRDTEILRRLTARLTLKPPQDTPNELRMHTPPRGRDKNSGCCEHVFYPAVFNCRRPPPRPKKNATPCSLPNGVPATCLLDRRHCLRAHALTLARFETASCQRVK